VPKGVHKKLFQAANRHRELRKRDSSTVQNKTSPERNDKLSSSNIYSGCADISRNCAGSWKLKVSRSFRVDCECDVSFNYTGHLHS
jgi:hypothetical protein